MVRVTLYGNLAEAIGREVELAIDPGTTIGAARKTLCDRFPQAAALLGDGVRGCIGDEIVGDAAIVPEGAELAFFPPLSGG